MHLPELFGGSDRGDTKGAYDGPLLCMDEGRTTRKDLQEKSATNTKTLATIKQTLSINALCACVYIYIRQPSSFREPTVVYRSDCCYTFLSLCLFFFTRKRTKHENAQSPPFFYVTKMAAGGCWARKIAKWSGCDDWHLKNLSVLIIFVSRVSYHTVYSHLSCGVICFLLIHNHSYLF